MTGRKHFSVADFRKATRDERYWKQLASISPEEKIRQMEQTRALLEALRKAVAECTQRTRTPSWQP